MRGKVSSLVALLFGIILGVTVSAQEIPKNLGISKRFDNYQTKSYVLPKKGNIDVGGYNFRVRAYSLDGRGKIDVKELYEILLIRKRKPLFYMFDLNDNWRFEENEVLMDKKRDGLNGNEEWFWMMMEEMLNGVF